MVVGFIVLNPMVEFAKKHLKFKQIQEKGFLHHFA